MKLLNSQAEQAPDVARPFAKKNRQHADDLAIAVREAFDAARRRLSRIIRGNYAVTSNIILSKTTTETD